MRKRVGPGEGVGVGWAKLAQRARAHHSLARATVGLRSLRELGPPYMLHVSIPRASCEYGSLCLVHFLQYAQCAGLQLKPQAHTLLSRTDRQIHVVAIRGRVLKGARELVRHALAVFPDRLPRWSGSYHARPTTG